MLLRLRSRPLMAAIAVGFTLGVLVMLLIVTLTTWDRR